MGCGGVEGSEMVKARAVGRVGAGQVARGDVWNVIHQPHVVLCRRGGGGGGRGSAQHLHRAITTALYHASWAGRPTTTIS